MLKEVGPGAETTATTPKWGEGLQQLDRAARPRAAVSEMSQTSDCEQHCKWRDGRQWRKHWGREVWANKSLVFFCLEIFFVVLLLSFREAELGMYHLGHVWGISQPFDQVCSGTVGEEGYQHSPWISLCLVGGRSKEFQNFCVPQTASSLVCCIGTLLSPSWTCGLLRSW